MDLLRDNVRAVYRKYFLAAFGSALISCIYGVVDMAMVGQYQGPDGTAALAVVAPVWNIINSLCLLTGIGGSVLLSAKRGSGAAGQAEANAYFTTAVLASVLLPLNIFSTYYFQAILKPGAAFFVSVARGARHQRRADFAAAGRAWAGLDLVGHAGHGAAGRVLCRGGHAARDAGAAAVLKPGLSAYTPVIGGDVHEALEGLFVRGSVSAADGGEDGRTGGGNGRA